MSDIPVEVSHLESIVETVAQNLLTKWAEEGRINEDNILNSAQVAVDDTVFVINRYMEEFNNLVSGMEPSRLSAPQLIIPKSDQLLMSFEE